MDMDENGDHHDSTHRLFSRAILGVRERKSPKAQYWAKPLVWTEPPEESIEDQFETMMMVLKQMYGFSESQLTKQSVLVLSLIHI